MNNSTHERNVAGRGLEQINAECLKLKRQLKVRDKQLEDLTEEANQLQFRNGELSEKLASIRVDMGLPAAQEATDEEEEGAQGRPAAGERPKALMQVRNDSEIRCIEVRLAEGNDLPTNRNIDSGTRAGPARGRAHPAEDRQSRPGKAAWTEGRRARPRARGFAGTNSKVGRCGGFITLALGRRYPFLMSYPRFTSYLHLGGEGVYRRVEEAEAGEALGALLRDGVGAARGRHGGGGHHRTAREAHRAGEGHAGRGNHSNWVKSS